MISVDSVESRVKIEEFIGDEELSEDLYLLLIIYNFHKKSLEIALGFVCKLCVSEI